MTDGKKMWLLCLAGILFIHGAEAFDWPADDVRVIATFGQSQWGDYLKGVHLYSQEEEVRPIDSGEVIFTCGGVYAGPHRISSGLGNMVVMQHDRGIRSVYGHLRELPGDDVIFIESDQFIGRPGNTGMIDEKALYLQIIDSEVSRYVNPLLSLPSLPDRDRPVIDELTLVKGLREYSLQSGMRIQQGEYQFRLHVYDSDNGLEPDRQMSVYSVKIYINGEERQAFSFESLMVNNRQTVPAGRDDLPHQALYKEKGRMSPGTVSFQPGEAIIEVVAADFSGNESSRTIPIRVLAE